MNSEIYQVDLSPERLTSVCRNCLQLASDHLEQKCLFESTTFEAMTRAELIAHNVREQNEWKANPANWTVK